MSEMNHEHRRDELASYLLHALSPEEATDLERHLADCESCRAELERLRPVVQALPETVERIEPPARLRARVMTEVRDDLKGRADVGARRNFRLPWIRPVVALAGVAIAVTLVVFAIGEGGSNQDATTVSAGRAPGVTAELTSDGGSGTLRLANIRGLAPNEGLQAWVQRGERVQRAGALFISNPNGTAVTEIDNLDGVSTVMVTAEPRGGSAFPTSEPLVSVRVSN